MRKMENKKNKCLIVDDQKYFLTYLEILFEHNGFEVYSCKNAESAFEVLEQEEIDFIISDIYMPGMNGLQFLAKLKKNDATQDIPVLIISSNDSYDIIKQAMQLGAVGFMRKPLLQQHLHKVFDLFSGSKPKQNNN